MWFRMGSELDLERAENLLLATAPAVPQDKSFTPRRALGTESAASSVVTGSESWAFIRVPNLMTLSWMAQTLLLSPSLGLVHVWVHLSHLSCNKTA